MLYRMGALDEEDACTTSIMDGHGEAAYEETLLVKWGASCSTSVTLVVVHSTDGTWSGSTTQQYHILPWSSSTLWGMLLAVWHGGWGANKRNTYNSSGEVSLSAV